MRTNSIIKLVLAFLVMAVVMVNLHLSSEENHRIFLSLTDIEKEAKAEDINYYVPQKNNNPDGCTIYLEISGGVGAPEGAIHVGGNKYKIEGTKNFCADPPKGEKPYGCDPYNCHQRV